MSTADASFHVTLFAGACYFSPLIGGLLADSYLNRFRTILIFGSIYFVGLVGIALSSWIFSYNDDTSVTPLGFAIIFWICLYLASLGTGL